jgi:hypothetical protein
MLYAGMIVSDQRLKDKLRHEISQLRYCLARFEQGLQTREHGQVGLSVDAASDPVSNLEGDIGWPESAVKTVLVYRSMIRQREHLYAAIK